ncbi:hypothetical protein HDV01_004546 [Terramyces sp. JEL0728]|nr:hypothetical protein HDV01_004546 [Terramyces sp. JEL0728]
MVLITNSKDDLITKVAITGVSFIGKAAWSFTTQQIQLKLNEGNLKKKLKEKLELKTLILQPIINKVLVLVDHISKLDSLSAEEAIDYITDLIPLLTLYISTSTNKTNISRILLASHLLNQKKSFIVKIYYLFNGVTIQWKEEMNKAKVRIIETEQYEYNLEVIQEFDDDRYHDELPIILKTPVVSIEKIFYTVSSKLLKINEESNPVLVLKLKDSKQEWIAVELYDYQFKNRGDTESEKESESASESEEELVNDVEKLTITPKSNTPFQTPFYSKPETPLSTPRTPSKVPSKIPTSLFDSPSTNTPNTPKTPKTPAKHNTPGVDTPSVFTVTTVNQKLNDLCLLESILRLSILENLENKRVYEVDEDTLLRYIEK